ncbi:MAG TPA: hypothetical protein VLR26_15295 [Frankiaceae bacterium]|nr:hypothetical protein [Frankiaceae bacterium]
MSDKPTASGKPLWRQAYDAVDTRVAPPLESLVQTKRFAQVLSLGLRAQNEAWRAVERRSRQLWHLVNLPAGSDVTRLREQVVTLDRRVRELTRTLEETHRAQSAEPARDGRSAGAAHPPRSRTQRTSRP